MGSYRYSGLEGLLGPLEQKSEKNNWARLLERMSSLVRKQTQEQILLEQNQKRHQATGIHVQVTDKRRHARQGSTGLSETFGMRNMKGTSKGNLVHITLFCGGAAGNPLLNPYAH